MTVANPYLADDKQVPLGWRGKFTR